MGEIVNLKRVKKARAKAQAAELAAENRARHGLSQAERDRQEQERAVRENLLDQARIERPEPE